MNRRFGFMNRLIRFFGIAHVELGNLAGSRGVLHGCTELRCYANPGRPGFPTRPRAFPHASPTIVRPPSTTRLAPVMKEASSDARNTTAEAMSSGRPSRYMGGLSI